MTNRLPQPELQKHESPAFAGLSFESWRETRDSNPGNAINVRRFSRPPCKLKRPSTLKAFGVPLLAATSQAAGRILQGVRFWFGNCFGRSPGVLPNEKTPKSQRLMRYIMTAFGQKRSFVIMFRPLCTTTTPPRKGC